MNDVMYIEYKKNKYHIMREICHSKKLNHYTRYSITNFNTKERAWEYMTFLSEQTDIPIKKLY